MVVKAWGRGWGGLEKVNGRKSIILLAINTFKKNKMLLVTSVR